MTQLQESLAEDLVQPRLRRPPQAKKMGVSRSSLQTQAQQVTISLSIFCTQQVLLLYPFTVERCGG